MQEYADSVFSKSSRMLESFMTYISASNNPAINSLMYIPLNAAIIVEIFRAFKVKNMSDLPHTLTELYTQLCLTILKRYFHAENLPFSVQKFEKLPKELHQKLKDLSEIAFTGIKNEEVIFHSLPSDLVFLMPVHLSMEVVTCLTISSSHTSRILCCLLYIAAPW